MNHVWKAVEVDVPAHLSAMEVSYFIHSHVHQTASRHGERVGDLRIGYGLDPRGDWRRWSASYLPVAS